MKEFEEKRGDRDVESVFKVLETVTELNGGEIDKVKAQCDSTLPTLNSRLLVANSMCTKILDQERSSEIVSILSLIKGDQSYQSTIQIFKTLIYIVISTNLGTSPRK